MAYLFLFHYVYAGFLGLCALFPLDKTGQFLRLIVYTSLTLLTLQCFMQIPFAYIPPHGKCSPAAKTAGWKIHIVTCSHFENELGYFTNSNQSLQIQIEYYLFVCLF